MSQDSSPQPTRKLVTSTPTAAGLPTPTAAVMPTATGALTSGQATMSAATMSTISAPPAKGSKVPAVLLSIALAGVGAFAFLQWQNGNNLTDEVATLNQKVGGLESQLTALKEENAKNLANYEETKSNLEASESKGRELQIQLDEKLQSLSNATSERDQLKTSLSAKTAELTKKESELTEVMSEKDEMHKKLIGLEQSGASMEKELSQLRDENDKMRAEKFKNSANIPGGTLDQASAAPKTEQVAVKKPLQRGIAWVKLGEYQSGENKGKWYYVGPDDFTSKLYPSRKEAIEAAEKRLGVTQSKSR